MDRLTSKIWVNSLLLVFVPINTTVLVNDVPRDSGCLMSAISFVNGIEMLSVVSTKVLLMYNCVAINSVVVLRCLNN